MQLPELVDRQLKVKNFEMDYCTAANFRCFHSLSDQTKFCTKLFLYTGISTSQQQNGEFKLPVKCSWMASGEIFRRLKFPAIQ